MEKEKGAGQMIHLINADVSDGLHQLPDQSVQCVCTSPPYWGLRDYGVEGQIGLEKTPEEYVNKMVEVFREVKRVLRNDGTLWLNIGDCYSGSWGAQGGPSNLSLPPKGVYQEKSPTRSPPRGLKQKDLVGIPWRVALALQKDGWYLRSDIIWNKPNPMPSSVEDRPTTSHEYIFLLTKSAKYFYDGEAIREKSVDPPGTHRGGSLYSAAMGRKGDPFVSCHNHSGGINSLLSTGTRNKRSVWEIATEARPEAHFATFPSEIPRVCISAGTSEYGCCPSCGAPWKRIIEVSGGTIGESWHPHLNDAEEGQISPNGSSLKTYKREMKGWSPTCKCGIEERVPCTVLDPFGGSGTTAKVARELNRGAILIEIKPEYIQIARKILRLNEQLVTS